MDTLLSKTIKIHDERSESNHDRICKRYFPRLCKLIETLSLATLMSYKSRLAEFAKIS